MVVITISGPAGSGKSTAGKSLSEKLGISYYSVGDFFRMKAEEAGMDVKEFMKTAPNELHNEADKFIDTRSKQGNVVIESRLSGHMASAANFRIFLTAPLDIRAKRVAGRKDLEFKEAKKRVEERDNQDRENYLRVYDIDVNELGIYDLVLNTEKLNKAEVLSILEKIVRIALKI
ncbi:MAG: AAA family ATPase [Candidatus Altiarchaeota archaeon]|nr:AAA family ATPase [Candidatus Altiarchaeota archaeon]